MLKRIKEMRNASTTYLFQAYRRQIASDRTSEINRHKSSMKLKKAGVHQLINIYADGDSWMNYPIHKDLIGWLREDAASGVTILNMAHYGDASTETLGVTKRERMKQLWQDPEHGEFDAICVSMGGNDICGDQFIMWIDPKSNGLKPSNAILEDRLTDMLYIIKSAYEDLIALRNEYLPNAVIFTHSYDFVQPTGIGVCGIGPWLKPSLDFLGWTDPNEAKLICFAALLAFDLLMTNLEVENKNVVYVRTQGTLRPDEFSNELHATEEGFHKLATKLLEALRRRFPGRV